MMSLTVALIPSPLVSAFTWALVAAELRRRGVEVVLPDLEDDGGSLSPFWRQHVASAVRAIEAIPASSPLVLAGHSGAGPLLPAIGAALEWPVRGYLFVDAGIPVDGLSRLQLMEREDPAFAAWFRGYLMEGGRYPVWGEEELAPLVRDAGVRRQVIAGLRPRGEAFFDEPIPVPAGWPEAPCGYLQLSAAYDVPARQARERGWPVARIDAGHFHPLVDPGEVAAVMLSLVDALDPAVR